MHDNGLLCPADVAPLASPNCSRLIGWLRLFAVHRRPFAKGMMQKTWAHDSGKRRLNSQVGRYKNGRRANTCATAIRQRRNQSKLQTRSGSVECKQRRGRVLAMNGLLSESGLRGRTIGERVSMKRRSVRSCIYGRNIRRVPVVPSGDEPCNCENRELSLVK